MTIGTRQRFRLKFGMLVGQVVLLVSVPGFLCVASSSPTPGESDQEESAAKGEVSFQLYNDNLIIVKATIGTVKNVNMILDTGTSPTAINQGMADRLNVRGKAGLLQTLNGTIQAQSIMLPLIQIGPLHADSITGVVQDLTFMERRLGISLGGIAGLDILSTCSFTIDYRRQKIIFGPVAASEKAIHFETQIPYLTVKAKIEGHEVRLLAIRGLGDCLSIATGCGPCRNNSMSIRILQYPPLADRLMSSGFRRRCRSASVISAHATWQSRISTPILNMISMASWDSQRWGSARCLSTSKMDCSDGIEGDQLTPAEALAETTVSKANMPGYSPGVSTRMKITG
jgi:hypothetical protein